MKNGIVKLGNIKLGSMPRVVIVLSGHESMKTINAIKSKGADVLELRVDQLNDFSIEAVFKKVSSLQGKGLPIIVTIRNKKEGGKRSISDEKRLELFKAVIPLVDAIDIELNSQAIIHEVVKEAKSKKKMVIVSHHDFKGTPSIANLKKIINEAKKRGADLVKIATLANKQEDVVRLTELTLECKDNHLVTIALGSKGSISRLVFPLFGSLLTYAYITKPSALGQLSFNNLREKLRFFYPAYNENLIKRSSLMECI